MTCMEHENRRFLDRAKPAGCQTLVPQRLPCSPHQQILKRFNSHPFVRHVAGGEVGGLAAAKRRHVASVFAEEYRPIDRSARRAVFDGSSHGCSSGRMSAAQRL